MIHALIFDLGNVLVYFSHERMFRQIGELVGRAGDEVRRLLTETDLLARYECGAIKSRELHPAIERVFAQPIHFESLVLAASDIFWRNESIEPVIDRLAADEYALVLLSNTCESHVEWLDGRFSVLRHFRRRVLSFEVGTRKPEPAIFEAAARAAGVDPASCFFTDDTPGHVEAARQLGFDAVAYRHTPQLVTELRARGITLFPPDHG
ncbi:MAG: HAD-IA family hydrolase [Planctomycetes bacterium]|nr:HAD-IA family hydrolase [Planctomycetota bacterium]